MFWQCLPMDLTKAVIAVKTPAVCLKCEIGICWADAATGEGSRDVTETCTDRGQETNREDRVSFMLLRSNWYPTNL